MSIKQSRVAEQGPWSGRCSWQGNIGCYHKDPVTSKQRKWSSQENKIIMECYLLSELKVRGCRNCMLSLWLKKCILGLSEQRLADLANTIHMNSWLTELQREELERNLAENDSCKEAEKRADTGNNSEKVRYILTALEADEIDNFEEEEVAIIEEIAELLERRQKTR